MVTYKQFSQSQLRLLWKEFENHPYVSQTEAEILAEKLNVYPERIRNWFKRQRCRGGLLGIESALQGRHNRTIFNLTSTNKFPACF